MTKKIKLILSIIAFVSALILSAVSHPTNNGKLLIFSLILIILGGLITSFTIAVWSKQNRKNSFLNNLPISFGLISIIFICGYLFTSLQPLI
ncbi:hypothetical protein Q4Q39_04715 [Flavivirga amylovorans]|uniref:Uncharacterized protein n=1 Tax=Flavivirga amylovorans TaxID=870486 RepID=A0ABT8WYE8_9FLAO|nr:hypothetical protein [Flavivirga amylovorans]MDO5986704.1 hypothetical protein [Flavivirga amylovorans]